MKTRAEAMALFAKETLYELITLTRTTATKFIVRAKNIATNQEDLFFLDCKNQTIVKQ